MTAKPLNVREHFDDYAQSERWQDLYRHGINTVSVPYILRLEVFAKIMADYRPSELVDAGCGSGDFIDVLPSSLKHYYGIDFSEEMIKAAQQKADERKGIEFTFSCGDFLTYEPGRDFEFVLSSGLVEYFEDLEPVYAKLYELTAPGGIMAVQVPNRKFYRWGGRHFGTNPNKAFFHHRISGDECDDLSQRVGFRKVKGVFSDHIYLPYIRRFPALRAASDRILSKVTPKSLSERLASMYIGVYQRP